MPLCAKYLYKAVASCRRIYRGRAHYRRVSLSWLHWITTFHATLFLSVWARLESVGTVCVCPHPLAAGLAVACLQVSRPAPRLSFFCLRLLRGSPSLHFWDELHIHAGIVCLRPRWLCKRWCGINLLLCALCHFSLRLHCISALGFLFYHETDDYGLSEAPQDYLFVSFCWCLVQKALRGGREAILRKSITTASKEILWLQELG